MIFLKSFISAQKHTPDTGNSGLQSYDSGFWSAALYQPVLQLDKSSWLNQIQLSRNQATSIGRSVYSKVKSKTNATKEYSVSISIPSTYRKDFYTPWNSQVNTTTW